MQIRLYHDLEEIKPGGIKRLKKRQIISIVLTFVIAIPAILLLNMLCGLEITLSCYIGIILAFPVCFFGMFQKNGMSYFDYRRAKRQMRADYEYQTRRYERKGVKKHENAEKKGC